MSDRYLMKGYSGCSVTFSPLLSIVINIEAISFDVFEYFRKLTGVSLNPEGLKNNIFQ